MQQQVILKLKPRPLRLVYLIDSSTDLTNAVTLYTHIWGGFSNAIFPLPSNVDEIKSLQSNLHSINPDYIFLPENDISSDLVEDLDRLPSYCLKFSSEQIKNITDINGHLYYFPVESLGNFSYRDFPHIIRILNFTYKAPLHNSNFFLTSHDSLFDFETSLQFGRAFIRYQGHLRNHLNARLISINSIENFIKISLMSTLGVLRSPLSITNTEITYTESSFGWNERDHNKVFNLFLYESDDLHIAASFWNSRRVDTIGYSNKLVLSKDNFIENLNKCILLLAEFLPSMIELQIYVTMSDGDAVNLGNRIHHVFTDLNRNVCIKVFHQSTGFYCGTGRVYCSRPIVTTREIYSLDRSIRFSPIVPTGYDNSGCVFGYDAEIEFSNGKSFSMPLSQASAVLVSNSIEQVEYAERSPHSSLRNWKQTKTQPIRPDRKGVTGITTANEECRIYFPESQEIIARWLKNEGFLFKPNDHTLYAKGFIKRFGGFEKTKYLINSGGSKIFIALDSDKAKQCGFKHSEIVGNLSKILDLKHKDAIKIVDLYLPDLLEAGLIYRGYPLKCSSCGLKDWYKLEKISEFIECSGCAEHFQIPTLTSLEFAYKPNELASRFLNSGGQAILSTAVFLSYLASSGHTEFGGDLIHLGENQSFAEIDLFVLVKDFLILAECKSYRDIDETKAHQIIEHLARVVETAILVKARVVILGVTTTSSYNFSPLISNLVETAAERGIGVHLLINDRFYLWGREENQITEPWQLSVDALLVTKESLKHSPVFVGEPIKEYSWEEEDRLINRDLIEAWKQELDSFSI
jgi:hypothetical protein